MEKTIIKFGVIEIEKQKFYQHKKLFNHRYSYFCLQTDGFIIFFTYKTESLSYCIEVFF